MRLFGIEPERPGHELWSFECPKCHHIQTKIEKADEVTSRLAKRAEQPIRRER